MQLIRKLFGHRDKEAERASQFRVSSVPAAEGQAPSRQGPHRDLVRISLRETMRQHGVPSDWIDCRTLSVATRQRQQGMHVQFLVRQADHQLLPHVHAIQESFWREVLRTDPQAKDWLFSVGWEFYGQSVHGSSPLTEPKDWKDSSLPATDGAIEPTGLKPDVEDDGLASDLEALQSVMSAHAGLTDLPPAAPREHKPR